MTDDVVKDSVYVTEEVRPEEGSRAWFVAGPCAGRHPSVAGVLRQFAWAHLGGALRPMSQVYGEAAVKLAHAVEDGPELVVALRKLVEAKDAGVRALADAIFERSAVEVANRPEPQVR